MSGCENYNPEEIVRVKKGLKNTADLDLTCGLYFLTQPSQPPGRWHCQKWVELGYELKKVFNPAYNPVVGKWPN